MVAGRRDWDVCGWLRARREERERARGLLRPRESETGGFESRAKESVYKNERERGQAGRAAIKRKR